MKKYTSPKGWIIVPAGNQMPELFISPEGIYYKRKRNREKVDATVQTKYGIAELRKWVGSPQEQKTSHSIKTTFERKLNKGKHQKKKK